MSKSKTSIIYIPGLGDGYTPIRKAAIRIWNVFGANARVFDSSWRDVNESFSDKLVRLDGVLAKIEHSQRIVLVGESAGGAAAIAYWHTRQGGQQEISKIITVCGKNRYKDRVSESLYVRNPAFRDAMHLSDIAVNTITENSVAKFHIFYSPLDPTVRPVDTVLPGVAATKIPFFGHLLSIFFVLYIYFFKIISTARA